MRIVEIVGGFYHPLTNEQYAFYKRVKSFCERHNRKTIPLNKLNEKQRILCQALVDNHILDRTDTEYVLREV